MHRRIKRVERALSLKTRKKASLTEPIPAPKPHFEFEDTLVTQLRASDVLSNCYEDYDGDVGVDFMKDQSPKKNVILKHPCHHDSSLIPVWQAFHNLDKRGSGTVLLGRLMSLTSLIGPVLNPRFLTEKMVHEHFINCSHVSFNQYKAFIERCVIRNPLAFAIEWDKLRSVCWSQCETWHLQGLPFDIPEGDVPLDLQHTIYWLWCVFNQIAETDTYPPSADYEEIELLLRKLFSSIGIIWEEFDDNMSSVSSSSLSSTQTNNNLDQFGVVSSSAKSFDSSNHRVVEEEQTDGDDSPVLVTESLLVTFQQFLSIIADMLGSETVLSPSFGRAVRQTYLSEVDEIIKTGWMSLKKPGTDVWKRRWTVLRKNNLEFYSDALCEPMKYQITLNGKMHVESLPDTSSHKHRFRLVEREGDFNIAWEAEMSCSDAQHSHSWMLIINLTIKIQATGLSTKKVELAERRLERHRRRESEISAIEKKREAKKTRKKLQEVRERWDLMQTKLNERAAARDKAMETMQKMDEIYDKLQAITKKQSLMRKANSRIRGAFPSMSSDSGVEMTKDERKLLKTRDEKLIEQKEKMQKIEEEKKKLQEQLLDLQASVILARDTEKTLILVYGPEKDADFVQEEPQRHRAASLAVPKPMTRKFQKNRNSPSPYRKNTVPAISISTSALTNSPSSSSSNSSSKLNISFSQSHPELRNGNIPASLENGRLRQQSMKNVPLSSLDSDMSNISGERLV